MMRADSAPPSSNENEARGSRIPELDGLRGTAILLVVLMHYFYNPVPGIPKPLYYFEKLFALGWSGVDLFFVLSGFLIGGILIDHRESKSYFKTFYIRRFFRIIPLYYLWLLLLVAFVLVAGPFLRAKTHFGVLPSINFQIFAHFLFLQNLWKENYVTLSYWWLTPTWSLAVEEQFYLLAPLLIRCLRPRARVAVLCGVFLGAPLLRFVAFLVVGIPAWPAYQLMPCRADSLAVGILAAYLWRQRNFRQSLQNKPFGFYIAFALLLVCVLVIWWRYPNPNDLLTQTIGYSIIALFFGLLLLLSIGQQTGLIARLARQPALRRLGQVSYCLYLIHVAVGYFCFHFLTRKTIHFTGWRSGCIGLLSIAIAYGLARISWIYFEEPMLRRGHAYKY